MQRIESFENTIKPNKNPINPQAWGVLMKI